MYSTIRDSDLLGPFIGQKVIEITQQDAEDYEADGSYVMLHFEDGRTLKFPITDEGFHILSPDA